VQVWNGGAERLTGLRAFEAEGRRLLDLDMQVPTQAPVLVVRGSTRR
jgi:PAS domain-containing protein